MRHGGVWEEQRTPLRCTGAMPIARAGLLALTVAFLHLHKVYPWESVPGVLALAELHVTIKSPWAGALLHPHRCVTIVPLPYPFSAQMPPGRVAPGVQSWASSSQRCSRRHRRDRRSLGTEPRLAGWRGGAEGSLGASWSREFSAFLTPTHHHLMLGWEFWRSHRGHVESRPWEQPLVVCICSFSPRLFGSGAARGVRSPASHLKSIHPVSALSWSSFWLFPRSLSGFFSLPPY